MSALLVASWLFAQPADEAPAAEVDKPDAVTAEDTSAAARRAPPRRYRQGSLLRSEPVEVVIPDLRGPAELRRDALLATHIEHLAVLDVIATLAQKGQDVVLQDRVHDVRRAEVARHNRRMRALRASSLAAQQAGAPGELPADLAERRARIPVPKDVYKRTFEETKKNLSADDAKAQLAKLEDAIEAGEKDADES